MFYYDLNSKVILLTVRTILELFRTIEKNKERGRKQSEVGRNPNVGLDWWNKILKNVQWHHNKNVSRTFLNHPRTDQKRIPVCNHSSKQEHFHRSVTQKNPDFENIYSNISSYESTDPWIYRMTRKLRSKEKCHWQKNLCKWRTGWHQKVAKIGIFIQRMDTKIF